jgi:hypothetical protein
MFDRKLRIALQVINSQMKVISRQAKIIDNLTEQGKAKYLTSTYFINQNQIPDMAQIVVPGNQTKAKGQIVPRDASGNALPITSIDAVSLSYSSSDNSIATVSNSAGGAFEVTRNGGADGTVTVSYSATNAQGNPVSGSDEIVFEAVGTPVAEATALTADFTTE